MSDRLRIELFDGLRVVRGSEVISHFRTQKTGALLAYLALFRSRWHLREQLCEVIWPDHSAVAARLNLHNSLSALRVQLELPGSGQPGVFKADRTHVGLHPERVNTDVGEFEEVMAAAGRASSAAERISLLKRAVELYRGELLRGRGEDWVLAARARLAARFSWALDELTAFAETAGDLETALRYAEHAVAVDALSERARGRVMRHYALNGQKEAALAHFHELQRLLRQELDAAPSPELHALAQAIAGGPPPPGSRAPAGYVTLPAAGLTAGSDPPGESTADSASGAAAPPGAAEWQQEPESGAVPLHSPFYVPRRTDAEFHRALQRGDSIVLLRGPRQTGKTSLMARGLQEASAAGARVVLTDLRALAGTKMDRLDTFFFALAESLADQLGLPVRPHDLWDPDRGSSMSLRRYLRQEVLARTIQPLVWAIDEVDRLFSCSYSPDVFGLFRSWHNERALALAGPWHRLTLALAYSTESHAFVGDLNQSPFNVGTRLELEDFTPEQVADLNRRYGAPLPDHDLPRFMALLGGHPLLTRRALHETARRGVRLPATDSEAAREDGPFGDHLRRLGQLLASDAELAEALEQVLRAHRCPDEQRFYRLRSAGILCGEGCATARLRCELYRHYFGAVLAGLRSGAQS